MRSLKPRTCPIIPVIVSALNFCCVRSRWLCLPLPHIGLHHHQQQVCARKPNLQLSSSCQRCVYTHSFLHAAAAAMGASVEDSSLVDGASPPSVTAAGASSARQSPQYGANLTTRQFVTVVIALALGTILEWYEFFAYSMLSSVLAKVFFPSTNPTLQQISFWGVFFVGFVARPFGSVLFGHIGDTRGRRLTLLLSIVCMAVPTVLIGCLPTYEQIGVAAPVLLALLRLVQGVAMGGEFGSALVYLHEIANKEREGFTGSVGFASAISGCMLGVVAVMILEAVLSPTQMLVFGWRIPFLASVVSASAALALRLHMPEPTEFLREKALLESGQQEVAAVMRSASQLSRLSRMSRKSHLSNSKPADSSSTTNGSSAVNGKAAAAADIEAGQGLDTIPSGTAAAAASEAAAATATAASSPHKQQQQLCPKGQSGSSSSGGSKCTTLPFVLLMRWHWAGVLLQFAFEAWVSVSFYTLTTWLPNHMAWTLGLPLLLTRGMLVVNLTICVLVQLLAGAASDKGLPRLWSAISVFVIAGAITAPIMLRGMRPGDLTSAWLLHALLLALVGWVLGLIPAACSPIYPASVRTSGFNLAHNMAMSWLGGLSPTIVTALTPLYANKFMAPTIWLVAAAGLSLVAGVLLLGYAPAANGRLAQEDAQVVVVSEQQQEAKAGKQLGKAAVGDGGGKQVQDATSVRVV